MTGADVVARALAATGVDTIFALEDGQADALAEACAGSGLTVVGAPRGGAAVHMAHACARATGRLGVAVVPGGAGVHEVVPAVAHASASGTPLLLVGAGGPTVSGDGHGPAAGAVLRPLVDLVAEARDPAHLAQLVARASSAARRGRPGPVYLDAPADVLDAVVPEPVAWQRPRAHRALADPRAVAEAAALLAGAERPLVVAGSGVHWSGATAELLRLVERLGAPAIASHGARGVVPAAHPAAITGARRRAMGGADVALVVGSRLDAELGRGCPPRWAPSCRLIQVDVDEDAFAHGREPDVALLGDARGVLGQLAAAVPEGHAEPWLDELAEADADARERLLAAATATDDAIGPLRLCLELAGSLRPDAFVACDGSELVSLARAALPVSTPGGWLDAGASSSKGFGIAAAAAVAAVMPGRQCVAVLGGGMLELQAAELAAAARQGRGVLVVVAAAGDGGPPEQGAGAEGLAARALCDLARALGCEAREVTRPADLAPALVALASERPRVLAVRTQRRAVADVPARPRVVRS